MKKLQFDTGVQEYEVNGRGVLRMNPGDINLYNRFMDAKDRIAAIEDEMLATLKENQAGDETERGARGLQIMGEADRKAKALLAEIFGAGNDFDEIFDHVNIMAQAGNGELVITNFFAAVAPLLKSGAESYAKSKAATAKTNRAQRRAAAKQA